MGGLMAGGMRDLRVLKTREAICSAFDELVLEKDADRITVKELAERARINRKTFYLHFETMEALFDDRLRRIMDEYFEEYETTPSTSEDLAGHAIRFFRFLASQPETIERLVCCPSSYDFGGRLYYDQMMRYKDAGGNPFGWLDGPRQELVLHFIRSTALEFYRGWVRGGKDVPVDEAAALLATLTCSGADAFVRSSPADIQEGVEQRMG